MKSLEYPLGPSLLTQSQCDKIHSPVLTTCLQKCGVPSTLARAIVHGPPQYGGLNFTNLYTEAGIQKLELFIGHVRKNDRTGSIIHTALGVLQQEVGISTPVLESPYEKYKAIVTKSWISELWQFISRIKGTITYARAWTPTPTFSQDINIMEEVMKWDLSDDTKYRINICRLKKRVYYLGDLLDPTGTRFKSDALTLTEGIHNNKFPTIQLPPTFHELWQSTIRRLLHQSPIGRRLGKLTSSHTFQWTLSESRQILIQAQESSVSRTP